ncbi:MAG TPA: RluA family pseudouridine synthase [Bacteroidales bacterium]|jgi:23S rRNA pseudouridine1911/1915/1917 synthase|nr:RluA family pseudouridine synthase [Bacteroidales bacterium]
MIPNNIEPAILYEDNHIIIVNKRAGEIVQGDSSGDEPLSVKVARYIAMRDSKPGNAFIGVPHRLDRPVSGIALFAKTSKALERMNALFRNGEVEKIYWAIVANKPNPSSGELRHFIVRNQDQNKSYAYDVPKEGAKEAILRYRLLSSGDRYHLLEILLLTGRHHQIRCQLSKIGCPIKGDLKYGAPRSNPDGGILLHARSIRFKHPVKENEIYVEAPVPDDNLWRVLAQTL